MAVAVVKKENESNEKLVSRFEKKVQQARLLQWLRKNRFHKDRENKKRVKEAGIAASRYRAERERLKYYQ
jgi:ribosomal protein S21